VSEKMLEQNCCSCGDETVAKARKGKDVKQYNLGSIGWKQTRMGGRPGRKEKSIERRSFQRRALYPNQDQLTEKNACSGILVKVLLKRAVGGFGTQGKSTK